MSGKLVEFAKPLQMHSTNAKILHYNLQFKI